MAGSKKEPMKPQPELTFEQTLAILAQVPKDEIEQMEAERPHKAKRKRAATKSK